MGEGLEGLLIREGSGMGCCYVLVLVMTMWVISYRIVITAVVFIMVGILFVSYCCSAHIWIIIPTLIIVIQQQRLPVITIIIAILLLFDRFGMFPIILGRY